MLIRTIKTIFPFIIAIILSLTACSKDDIMGSDSKAIKTCREAYIGILQVKWATWILDQENIMTNG